MKIFLRCSILILYIITTVKISLSQDLSAELSRVGEKNASNYVNPIFNGFAADLNSAFYHSADLHDILGFDIGVKYGFSLVNDADKKYDFITPDHINIKDPTPGSSQIISLNAGTDYDAVVAGTPTAVGDKNTKYYVKMIRSANDPIKQAIYDNLVSQQHGSNNLFEIPNGFDLPAVPLPMPQAAIGLPLGLEFMVRFIPTTKVSDAGKFNYMGFGLRYNIDQWIPICPVDLSVHFMTQKMNFKSNDDNDIFKATGYAYGAEVSKKLFFITIFGGFQLEKASFTLSKIDGEITTPDGTITPFTIPEMTFDGKNKSRITIGLRALLAVINLHVEYSVASSPVLAAGVGISIR